MKRAPSVLLPASAKNKSPGFTARLSTASPLIKAASACGSIVASSLNRSRSLIVFQSGRRGECYALLGSPRCRKNKAVGRRQIEARLDSQQWCNAGNDLAAGRYRVPPRSNKAFGFGQRLWLVQHHQHLELRIVGRNNRGKRVQHLLLGIPPIDDLFRGAGFAA